MVIIKEGVMHSTCMLFGVFADHKERWLVLLWGYTLLAVEYMHTIRFLYLLTYVCLMFSISGFQILTKRQINQTLHTFESQTLSFLKNAHISHYASVRM